MDNTNNNDSVSVMDANLLQYFEVSKGRWDSILNEAGLSIHNIESETVYFEDTLKKIRSIELLPNEKVMLFFYLGILFTLSAIDAADNAD